MRGAWWLCGGGQAGLAPRADPADAGSARGSTRPLQTTTAPPLRTMQGRSVEEAWPVALSLERPLEPRRSGVSPACLPIAVLLIIADTLSFAPAAALRCMLTAAVGVP